jgi:excisionase family DNA binding protein
MKYTIGEAAKATGKSKATISKAIKNGDLSAVRLGKTATSPFEIDASELFRVFPVSSPKNDTLNEREHLENSNLNSGLQVEVKMLREMLDREREISDDLRNQLDKAMNLLPKPQTPATPSLWQRLFGK